MSDRADQSFEVRAILSAIARRSRALLLLGLVTAGVSALVLSLTPRRYEGTMVLVPVQGSRAGAGLAGAASFLGGTLDLGSTGFDATRDVVAYLLRARTVLLAAAEKPYNGRPVAIPIVKREPKPGDEEMLLRSLRRALRVTTSKETGFVTVSAQAADSGAVRAFLGAVTDETQSLFAQVARSQARQLLRAQERRLDSADAELRRAEDRLLRFDEGNRQLTPRSRLSLERARLERSATNAARVYEQVITDRQSAIAHELEEAPAIAVVEQLPAQLPPKPRRVLFRSVLLGVSVALIGLLVVVTLALAQSSARLEGRGV
jgi:uncharacterized protein involved in exopolysaccharide biosynthesis